MMDVEEVRRRMEFEDDGRWWWLLLLFLFLQSEAIVHDSDIRNHTWVGESTDLIKNRNKSNRKQKSNKQTKTIISFHGVISASPKNKRETTKTTPTYTYEKKQTTNQPTKTNQNKTKPTNKKVQINSHNIDVLWHLVLIRNDTVPIAIHVLPVGLTER